MSSSQGLSAPRLKVILIVTIGLMIVLGIATFLFFQHKLSDYATEVNNDNVAAAASNQDVTMLQHLQTEMASNQVAVNRAASIVADSKYYQYQNQIIDDLNTYANAAGFSISGFSFADNTASTATTATSGTTATPATPAGLKSVTATITLPGSLSYQSVMNFLKSIEENLTKMDLNGVTMQMDTTTNTLTVNPISIKVYTR